MADDLSTMVAGLCEGLELLLVCEGLASAHRKDETGCVTGGRVVIGCEGFTIE